MFIRVWRFEPVKCVLPIELHLYSFLYINNIIIYSTCTHVLTVYDKALITFCKPFTRTVNAKELLTGNLITCSSVLKKTF